MKDTDKHPKHLPLGQHLKVHRNARGLTLDQLSRAAGVSKAMLSQIEQDNVNPTVAIILKIADALHIGIGELVDQATQKNILRLIPADDAHYTFRADQTCSIRTLSPLALEKNIEFYQVSLAPKGELKSEAHYAGTEEFLHLAKGKISITSGTETTSLAKGDSIHYRADVPHAIKNLSNQSVEAYLIVHYGSL